MDFFGAFATMGADTDARITAQGGMKMSEFMISSTAFDNNGAIPPRFTCDGQDVSPPIQLSGTPPGTASLALIVDDPDAPAGTWVHWVVWNIDPSVTNIPEGEVPRGGLEGLNDFGRQSYGGPCPPSGKHRYFFKVYALNRALQLTGRSTKAALEKAMKGHVIAQAQLVGLYSRR